MTTPTDVMRELIVFNTIQEFPLYIIKIIVGMAEEPDHHVHCDVVHLICEFAGNQFIRERKLAEDIVSMITECERRFLADFEEHNDFFWWGPHDGLVNNSDLFRAFVERIYGDCRGLLATCEYHGWYDLVFCPDVQDECEFYPKLNTIDEEDEEQQ